MRSKAAPAANSNPIGKLTYFSRGRHICSPNVMFLPCKYGPGAQGPGTISAVSTPDQAWSLAPGFPGPHGPWSLGSRPIFARQKHDIRRNICVGYAENLRRLHETYVAQAKSMSAMRKICRLHEKVMSSPTHPPTTNPGLGLAGLVLAWGGNLSYGSMHIFRVAEICVE